MTLFPTKFENGKIEYKIRYKGRSRPFSRAKALTSEQSRDPTKLKELLSQVTRSQLDRQLDRARNKGNSIEFHNSTEKRSYSQKSEDCPGSIENRAKPCRAAGRGNEVRPKFDSSGRSRITTRETMSRGRPTTPLTTAAHDHAARAGKQRLAAARRNSRTTADAPSEPGSHVPRPAEKHRPILHPSDHAGRPRNHPATTVPIDHDPTVRPTVPTDRPNAAVDPKPFLKPNPHNSSPKPAPTS
ncbi:unnamed protein product [Microthlaspi erraticum]|uniref:Uncharacterized protein n=1 Tax=Microthlaspi erraticum TaxID=1685480 RepID=A0A6D2KF14_9BRAS|nr:unnamed protein product [Microthlaspi erraticum]